MNGDEQERRLLEKAKDLLSEAAENLDSQTKKRLERIRLDALTTVERPGAKFFLPPRWITASAFVTAAIAGVAIFFWLRASPGNFPGKQAEDFEIITSAENIEFYENLEFYRWLATKENGS